MIDLLLNKINIILVFSVIVALFGLNQVYGQVVSETPSYLTIDLSSSANPTDFPYGISCDDASYAWMTITGQGKLARIDKNTQSVSLFDNDLASTSGREWYSVVYEPNTDDLFVNERDNGLVLRYDKTGNTWTNIPLVTNFDSPDNPNISYPSGYSSEPATIRLNEATHGQHTYDLSVGSFGEMKLVNGYVWVVLNYNMDFDTEGNAILADQSFNGIIRINPTDNSITSFAIAGSSALRGITVDVSDPTIIWLSDNTANKIFKFSTTTNTVIDTINLPSGSNARGITNDSTNIYVAKNVAGGSGENSKIIQVIKATGVTSEIDTGASNTVKGTFSVFIIDGILVWTDESNHLGTINLSNQALKTVSNTTGQTSSNHFGCKVGSQIWIAGHGSAKVVSVSISSGSSDSSHGDSCAGDCYAPHLGNDENGKHFYDDGLTINGKSFEIKNQLHNLGNETIVMPVGKPVDFRLKVQDSYPDNVESCEVAVGIEKGKFVKQSASYILGVKRTFDGKVSMWSEGDVSLFRDFNATMNNIENNVFANFTWVPTSHLQHDMFALECKDIHRYYVTYFVNHGIMFRGISEIGTPQFDYTDDDGRIHVLTIVDPTLEDLSLAIDESGNYWSGDFGSLWSKQFVRPDMTGSLSKYHGYDRNDYYEFKAMKLGQELIGRTIFDSSLVQTQIKPSFAYEITNYGRLHDPVPNMMKAQADLAIKNLSKQ